MSAGRGEAGFSLIEALVALAILATAAVSLLAATEAHVARINGLEVRTLAQFAAENHLAALELGAEPGGSETLLGYDFNVTSERTPTADPELMRLDISVRRPDGTAVLGGFVGFLDAQVLP